MNAPIKTSLLLAFTAVVTISMTAPAQAYSNTCYAFADNGNQLVYAARTPVPNSDTYTIGSAAGVPDIEATALQLDGTTLYAADADTLGILNTTTGAFSPIGGPFGSGTGPLGTITFSDVDGISFDAFTGLLWGVHRRANNANDRDVLFRIDHTTGLAIPDVFGPGVDYVEVGTNAPAGDFVDLDDISVHPITGVMYAAANTSGTGDHLIIINKTTGDVTDIARFTLSGSGNVDDIEGLSFYNDGSMYGVTGDSSNGSNSNKFFTLDPSDAELTFIATLPTSDSDYESVACLSGGGNNISGTVFVDGNNDGLNNDGAGGWPNVDVQLYRDANGNGIVDAGDELVQTETTDANGDYAFLVAAQGSFVLQFDTGTQPADTVVTTDNVETAVFNAFGQTDPNNDFGLNSAYDFGDAPASYSDASHNYSTTQDTLYIGTTGTDGELSTQGTDGTGDDSDGGADEDGVRFVASNGVDPQEVTAEVSVVNDTGAPAYLCGWLDVDLNGVFDAGDARTCQEVADNNGVPSTVSMTWTGLPEDAPGTTYARFRLCNTLSECDTPENSTTTTTPSSSVTNSDSEAIPDGSGTSCVTPVVKTFNISNSYTIADLTLTLNIEHTYRDDFNISLQSPTGTTVVLTTRATIGAGSDNINVVFDDAGSAYISDTANHVLTNPPLQRSPIGNLSDFNDEDAIGTWTLTMCDSWGGDTGTFNSATLDITGNPVTVGIPASTGEVEDHRIDFDFRPTAVTIGKVELEAVQSSDFLAGLGADNMSAEALLALLAGWDAELAASLSNADAQTIRDALQNYLDPEGDGQLAVFRWDTLEERGTIGFYVHRRTGDTGDWERINDDLLPGLITAPMGGEYQLADPSAQAGIRYQYHLIELEATGTTRNYGPYSLELQ